MLFYTVIPSTCLDVSQAINALLINISYRRRSLGLGKLCGEWMHELVNDFTQRE